MHNKQTKLRRRIEKMRVRDWEASQQASWVPQGIACQILTIVADINKNTPKSREKQHFSVFSYLTIADNNNTFNSDRTASSTFHHS